MSGPWEDFVPKSTPATEAGPWQDFATPGVAPWADFSPPSEKYSITRGLVSGFLEEQPELLGKALEGLSHLAPESFGSTLRSGSEWLKEKSKTLRPEEYRKQAKGFWDIGGVDDALTWAGETLGSGLSSTAMPIATGLAGAAAGTAIAPGVGTIVGGVAGGMMGGSPLNYGEVFKALQEEKVPDAEAAKYAAMVTPLMAGLDVAGLALPVARAAGLGGLRQQAARGIARRIAAGLGIGAIGEAGTEAAQEGVKLGLVSAVTPKPFLTIETLKQIVEAGVGGALVGGTVGGAAGLRRDQVQGEEPTPDDLVLVRSLMTQPPLPPGVPPPPPPPGGLPPLTPGAIPPLPLSPTLSNPANLLSYPPRDLNAGFVEWANEHLPTTPPSTPFPTQPIPSSRPIQPENLIPADTVEQLTKKAAEEVSVDGLTIPSKPIGFSELLSSQKQGALAQGTRTVPVRMSVDEERMVEIYGPHQYGDLGEMPRIVVKETLQNAVDNIRPILEKDPNYAGLVDFTVDPKKRTITIHDNGTGMTPETVAGPFLQMAGTKKESVRRGGGYGFAKSMYLIAAKSIKLITARDGEVSTLITTGPELKASLRKDGKQPNLQVRPFTREDLKLFPQGHGASLELGIPEGWVDAEGNTQPIDISEFSWQHKSLRESPLFDNVKVRFNGEEQPIGSNFPKDEFTPLLNVNFPWGTTRLYVSQNPVKYGMYESNIHVLSTGLQQFSLSLSQNGETYGPKIDRTFYIDVIPNIKPEEPNYPFNTTRQGFSKSVQPIFTQLLRHLTLMYKQEELNLEVEDFGEIQFLAVDERGGVVPTGRKRITPPPPKKPQILRTLTRGDKVDVIEGKMVVKGRQVQELTMEDFRETKTDLDSLTVPQGEIDSNIPLLHDITLMPATGRTFASEEPVDPFAAVSFLTKPEPIEGQVMVSMTQHGVEKFGQRFYEYLYLLGSLFHELRGPVAGYSYRGKGYESIVQEAVGLSMAANDKNGNNYYGLSIRVPFSASLLNPFLAEFPDNPAKTAVGMITTMIHEFGHKVHRSENGLGPVIQSLLTQLETDQNFNFQDFKQRTINVLASYYDIFTYMNGAYNDGIVVASGRRFEGVGHQQRGDGSSIGDPGPAGANGRRGTDPGAWVALSNTAPPRKPGPSNLHPHIKDTGVDASFGADENQRALDREGEDIRATQQQSEFAGTRASLRAAIGGPLPQPVKAAAAWADRMNWTYKWFAGVHQLTDANQNFTPLLDYNATIRLSDSDQATIQDAGTRIHKDWRSLGLQGENLTALLDELARMTYLTPAEINAGVERQPTAAEFDALIAKHKVGGQALKVLTKIKKFFDLFIDLNSEVSIKAAQRKFTDPARLVQKIDEIRNLQTKLKSRPYFPFMNFGRHYVEVKNAAGDRIRFETFERQGFKTAERRQKEFLKREVAAAKTRGLGETVKPGIIPEQASPFIGMPPGLLESIRDNLTLTPTQNAAIEQLLAKSSTMTSFARRFENKSYTPGYSMDFKRAFATYVFHGSRYYARTKYVWSLRQNIEDAAALGGNKESRISEYMADHLQNTILDAKGDFGIFKGAIFFWAMGFVPAAAFQNLSQTPMVTWPYLASKFGDVRATAAIVKAMSDIRSFYKRGSYTPLPGQPPLAFEMRALEYGIKTGRISESQAAELAGLAQGEGLLRGLGGNAVQRGAVFVQEKAAWMFEMAEQFNRRIAYRAALSLAYQNPNAKEVQFAIKKYEQEYTQLLGSFTLAEAKAIITANHVVEATQYIYSRSGRARFMRGRLPGTIFVFKQFMQSTLMLLAHNKSDVLPRYLLVAAAIGGLSAFPGWEDWREIIRGVGRWKFGKDYDLNKEIREYIANHTDGTIPADMVLHGLARKGFGVPALLDAMGSFYTGTPGRGLISNPNQVQGQNFPFPVVDMSRQISMGPIFPAEIGKLIAPTRDSAKVLHEQTQRASGAVFSVGFNMYKAIMDNHLEVSDPKRWERAVPRALASTSKAFRSFNEERERSGSRGPNAAPTIVEYDRRDTEHMMELLTIAGGFQTNRLQTRWDSIIAEAEMEKFYDLHRTGLMEQMFEAVKGRNPREIEDVRDLIIQFNLSLPDQARGKSISGEGMRKSMQTRQRELLSRESGVPSRRTNAPISQHIDRLFPEGTVEIRRVR